MKELVLSLTNSLASGEGISANAKGVVFVKHSIENTAFGMRLSKTSRKTLLINISFVVNYSTLDFQLLLSCLQSAFSP